MYSQDIKTFDRENVMATYARFDVCFDHGKGATLYTPEGKEYIDFTSGIGVCSVGYGNPDWAKAVSDQAMKLGHVSNLYYTEPYAAAAEKLMKASGMSKIFFANSGAEANEGAIKVARKYSYDKYGTGRSTILTLNNSFHGRTVTTLAATGQEHFHQYFFPFTGDFKHCAANIEAVKTALTDTVCAVMFELVQGEGGVFPLDRDFVTELVSICRARDILVIVDEVQTGIGRTGTLFAYQQFGFKPDIVSVAKGLGGGLPIGGVITADTCDKVLSAGLHGSTFGGNPVSCAAANMVLDTVNTPEFLAEVKAKGEYIREKISAMNIPFLTNIRGLGMMLGIGVDSTQVNKVLVGKMVENGLLCLTAGNNTIRLLPPLTISYDELDRGLKIFEETLKSI